MYYYLITVERDGYCYSDYERFLKYVNASESYLYLHTKDSVKLFIETLHNYDDKVSEYNHNLKYEHSTSHRVKWERFSSKKDFYYAQKCFEREFDKAECWEELDLVLYSHSPVLQFGDRYKEKENILKGVYIKDIVMCVVHYVAYKKVSLESTVVKTTPMTREEKREWHKKQEAKAHLAELLQLRKRHKRLLK